MHPRSWKQILDQANCPKLPWILPNLTRSVESSLSKESVVFYGVYGCEIVCRWLKDKIFFWERQFKNAFGAAGSWYFCFFLALVAYLFHIWNLLRVSVCSSNNNEIFLFFRLFWPEKVLTNRWQLYCRKRYIVFMQMIQKTVFTIQQTATKIKGKEYCFVHHDNIPCLLTDCRYHILMQSNVEELLRRLVKMSLTYLNVDYLYTIFMYQSSRKTIFNSG